MKEPLYCVIARNRLTGEREKGKFLKVIGKK